MSAKTNKDKLIFVSSTLSKFNQNDINILSKKYEVTLNIYNWKMKSLTLVFLLRQVFFLMWHIWSTKRIVVSFGGYWALIPAVFGRLTGVPAAIILHGTDCADFPQINYGSLRSMPLRMFCKYSYKFAKLLIPVSKSLVQTENTFYGDEVIHQGYQHFFPDVKTDYKVIHNGVDSDLWKPVGGVKREEKSFIAAIAQNQFIRKGGDQVVELAKKMPDCQFYIAGIHAPDHLDEVPENVHFMGRLQNEDLREYYNRCRFYLQISVFEGFGLALCEAMLCGCVPIGSNVNVIPTIIGDTGFILGKRDVNAFEQLARKALSAENKDELGKRARLRIMERYSMEKREEKLLSTIAAM